MRKTMVWLLILGFVSPVLMAEADWEEAAKNGEQQRRSLLTCWRFTQGWLQFADPITGLIPRNLGKDLYWNAKDAAADNYPFMVLSAFFTDRQLLEGRMVDILAAEKRYTNRVDHLPDDYVFATQAFRTEKPDMDYIIFCASEYVKDGLLPITEWMGPSFWSERMLELLDDIWKHAAIETEVGLLPSTSHEVAGEMMQNLSRMYWMTGKEAYKEEALKLASFYFDHHSPIEEKRLQLDDHGCEVIGGLSEAYYLVSREDPELHARWKAPMHAILDKVLEIGRDENGMLYMDVNPRRGKVLKEERTDNWGYNYNAFATVGRIDGVERYEEAIRHVLSRLMEYKDYPWEGDSADGLSDSLEGCLNLMNRYPCPQACEWADYTAERLLAKPRDTGVVEGWHGDGNTARTLIMYALWKSQGAYVLPWRADLRLGAAPGEDGEVCFQIEADWPWEGEIHFDLPRHREYLHMPEDYPRLNQFPEWFTVAQGKTYLRDGASEISATALRQGLTAKVDRDTPFRLRLKELK